ncbi:MAG: DNA cytosine methyltransferase [Kiritimatiellae bacterium]|nr:DNA cytosine methyltransferase [Kiritimatiellia bacterium]
MQQFKNNDKLPTYMSIFKVIDLFSGVGGFSLGAARAGFELAGAIELDPHAIAAHKVNFKNTIHWQKDISEITKESFESHFNLVTCEPYGLIGGPPCQGFSVIGKSDPKDPRRKLFMKFFELVKDLQPEFFLAENVPGLLYEKHRTLLNGALTLVSPDYEIIGPMKLTASDYGAPTTRTRVFIFGYKKSEFSELSEESFLPADNQEMVKVRHALNGLRNAIDPDWQLEEQGWKKVSYKGLFIPKAYKYRLYGHIPKNTGDKSAIKKLKSDSLVSGFLGTRHSETIIARYAAVKPGTVDSISKSRKLESGGFCPTLRAGTGADKGSFQAVRPLHPTEARVITPREAARLQGFPDWFQFTPTKWQSFRQIGNSVSPILAEHILKIIRTAYKGKV